MTKYRHTIFTDRYLTRCEQIMRAVCEDFEAELVEFNGEANHVHLLVNFPPKVAASRLVNSLKGVSSRRLRQEFPDLVRHYWRAGQSRTQMRFTTGLKPGALRTDPVAPVRTRR